MDTARRRMTVLKYIVQGSRVAGRPDARHGVCHAVTIPWSRRVSRGNDSMGSVSRNGVDVVRSLVVRSALMWRGWVACVGMVLWRVWVLYCAMARNDIRRLWCGVMSYEAVMRYDDILM
jgi:hypothetical protein